MNDLGLAWEWNVGLLQATVATVGTLLTIGVAFLLTPTRATLYWSCAFALAMVATFGIAASDANGAETIRRLCLGALMGSPALLWSGFRASWGARPFVWAGPVVAALGAIALVAVGESGSFSAAFRATYLVASLFALLFFIDWLRFADRRDRFLLPFAIISVGFALTGIAFAIGGVVQFAMAADDIRLVRVVTSTGMFVYVACALVAIIGPSIRERTTRRSASTPQAWDGFQKVAAERLAAAQASADQWSMVCLRLDDEVEISQAAGTATLSDISDRFIEVVRSTFPADADICPHATGTFVLVSRPDATVRALLSTCLERVGQLDVPDRLPVHPSASVGWAPTSTMGYDPTALILMSREAAVLSSQNGGDRWERMSAAVVQRLLAPDPGR